MKHMPTYFDLYMFAPLFHILQTNRAEFNLHPSPEQFLAEVLIITLLIPDFIILGYFKFDHQICQHKQTNCRSSKDSVVLDKTYYFEDFVFAWKGRDVLNVSLVVNGDDYQLASDHTNARNQAHSVSQS